MCATKHITLPYDLEIDKTGGYDRGLQLCLQQGTGNSASPQIDLSLICNGKIFEVESHFLVQFGCSWDGNYERIGRDGRKPPDFVE